METFGKRNVKDYGEISKEQNYYRLEHLSLGENVLLILVNTEGFGCCHN